MRALVVGDRDWDDEATIRRELRRLPRRGVVVHGDARGAERIADAVAHELGLRVEMYPATWRMQGRAAGPIRNRMMLARGNPDLVLAFHDNLAKSRGTKNMLALAQRARVKVRVVLSEAEEDRVDIELARRALAEPGCILLEDVLRRRRRAKRSRAARRSRG